MIRMRRGCESFGGSRRVMKARTRYIQGKKRGANGDHNVSAVEGSGWRRGASRQESKVKKMERGKKRSAPHETSSHQSVLKVFTFHVRKLRQVE